MEVEVGFKGRSGGADTRGTSPGRRKENGMTPYRLALGLVATAATAAGIALLPAATTPADAVPVSSVQERPGQPGAAPRPAGP